MVDRDDEVDTSQNDVESHFRQVQIAQEGLQSLQAGTNQPDRDPSIFVSRISGPSPVNKISEFERQISPNQLS